MRVTKDTVEAFCRMTQGIQPCPRQLEMLNESSRLTLYGGSRCPGKTHRAKLLRDMLAEAQHDHRLIVIDELVSNTERLSEGHQ